jgi:hypothetical protein
MSRRSIAARVAGLSAGEVTAALRTAALIPFFHVAIRVAGFNYFQSILDRRDLACRARLAGEPRGEDVRRYSLALSRAKRYAPFRGNCLSQSLTLVWLLQSRGIAPRLRLGARVRETVFEAHAWVEHDGAVLNDSADVTARFAPLR